MISESVGCYGIQRFYRLAGAKIDKSVILVQKYNQFNNNARRLGLDVGRADKSKPRGRCTPGGGTCIAARSSTARVDLTGRVDDRLSERFATSSTTPTSRSACPIAFMQSSRRGMRRSHGSRKSRRPDRRVRPRLRLLETSVSSSQAGIMPTAMSTTALRTVCLFARQLPGGAGTEVGQVGPVRSVVPGSRGLTGGPTCPDAASTRGRFEAGRSVA